MSDTRGPHSYIVHPHSSAQEIVGRTRLVELMKSSPIPDAEFPANVPLYINRQSLSHVLYMEHLYRLILPVHGVIVELGVRWGRNLALWTALRGIHEPYNFNRRIIGFDTFNGFPSVHQKDGTAQNAREGGFSVAAGYEHYLESLLAYQESECPVSHVTKHELVKGDVTETLPLYLENNPHTVVALAYLDLDLYAPTKLALDALRPRLTKGSILAFDEVNVKSWPGETLALMESIGLGTFALRRVPWQPTTSYMVVE